MRMWHHLRRLPSELDYFHVIACSPLPPADRTAGDPSLFRQGGLPRSHAPAPAGTPLHAAHSRGDARSRAHHAAARHHQGGQGVRAEARRLDCRAIVQAAGGDAIRPWHDGAAAGRVASHRASPQRARHGVDGNRRRRRTAALRGRRSPACRPPDQGFSQARGQARARGGEPALCGKNRRPHETDFRARPVEPLGLLLHQRRAVIFLAADPGAALRARLPRRARGRAILSR